MRYPIRMIAIVLTVFLVGGVFLTVAAQELPGDEPEGGNPPAEATAAPQPSAAVTPAPGVEGGLTSTIQEKESEIVGEEEPYEIKRDPFVNPLGRAITPEGEERPKPPGIAGMMISEVALWGVADFEGKKVAILKGTDGRGYFVYEGEPLWDGKVQSINVEDGTVVFEQEARDKTSPVTTTEVKKSLR
jgi:hypothetical protein